MPAPRLADGCQVFTLSPDDDSPSAMLSVGGSGGLMLSLLQVATSEVDGIPALSSIAPALIEEGLVALTSARYAYDLEVRGPELALESVGLVTAEMLLSARLSDAVIPTDKESEIETAFVRGLLDRRHRDIAGFRLRMRAVRDQLLAIRQSGYVPDWRVNILFATFYDPQAGQWVPNPLSSASLDDMEIRLISRARQRGFRLYDLFPGTSEEKSM